MRTLTYLIYACLIANVALIASGALSDVDVRPVFVSTWIAIPAVPFLLH